MNPIENSAAKKREAEHFAGTLECKGKNKYGVAYVVVWLRSCFFWWEEGRWSWRTRGT